MTVRTTPVALVEIGDRRWVVGTFGEVNWVRNLRAAGEAALSDVTPEDDALASAWYRRKILPVLVRRALTELEEVA